MTFWQHLKTQVLRAAEKLAWWFSLGAIPGSYLQRRLFRFMRWTHRMEWRIFHPEWKPRGRV